MPNIVNIPLYLVCYGQVRITLSMNIIKVPDPDLDIERLIMF